MKFKLAAALAAATLILGSAGAGRPAAASPTLGPLIAYGDWLSLRPSEADLRGRVVLVDIFTFGCFNCKNVTPNLRALYRKHDSRLAIIGVHTPETQYESERKNVVANLATLGIV